MKTSNIEHRTSNFEVRKNAPLSEFTTFKLGGPCRQLITCRTPAQLEQTVVERAAQKSRYLLMGGGSNILVSDAGYDGVIVRYVNEEPNIQLDGLELEVTGSTALDALAHFTMKQGLEGLMCCTGIPGTVGGAVVGNAGAWGKQIGDVLTSVALMDRVGKKSTVASESLGFAYRRSKLQQSEEIVVSARFRLRPGNRAEQEKERQEILRERAARHPDLRKDPCIGSIFRNIEPTSAAGRRQAAGWFLEQAGAKQMRVGGARVFERHANIIVKGEGCTAQDVYDLAKLMAAAVKEKFDLELVREVRYLGSFRGEAGAPELGFF